MESFPFALVRLLTPTRGRARDNISRIQGRLDRLEARFSKDDLCLNELPSIRFDHEAASDAVVTGYRPIAPAPNTVDPIQPASKQHDNTPAVRTWGDGLHHRDRPQADDEGNQQRYVVLVFFRSHERRVRARA